MEMTNGLHPSDAYTPFPRLNEPAPYFEAKTTQGVRRLTDYRGKWLVLFSHPADFTPVCTTEFIAFAKNYPKFQEINCDLLGLSIDSNFAHLAWVRNIKEKFGVEIPFPVIEDLTMKSGDGIRDDPPERKRHVGGSGGVCDRSGGRPSCDDLLSAVERPIDRRSPETARCPADDCTEKSVATPEGWEPGQKVIVPPPADGRRSRGPDGGSERLRVRRLVFL